MKGLGEMSRRPARQLLLSWACWWHMKEPEAKSHTAPLGGMSRLPEEMSMHLVSSLGSAT